MVEKTEYKRPASSGEGEIHSRLWVGETQRAVLQIAHGMAEHAGRYDEFATYLAENGFVVCANDHAGHGLSACTKGFFAEEDGWENALLDMKRLMEETVKAHAGLPVFLLGHSMGSFLSRSYLTRYGEGLAGCILSGTAGKTPGAGAGRLLASLQKVFKGRRSEGKFLNKLVTGGYNKQIENPVNEHAWLNEDDEVPIAYAKDELSGFALTAGGFYDMLGGLIEVTGKDWAAKVPRSIPLLLIAGAEDPVGNNGKGPAQTYDALVATGHTAQIILYEGSRHEILNGRNRQRVYEDVLAWLNARLG